MDTVDSSWEILYTMDRKAAPEGAELVKILEWRNAI